MHLYIKKGYGSPQKWRKEGMDEKEEVEFIDKQVIGII